MNKMKHMIYNTNEIEFFLHRFCIFLCLNFEIFYHCLPIYTKSNDDILNRLIFKYLYLPFLFYAAQKELHWFPFSNHLASYGMIRLVFRQSQNMQWHLAPVKSPWMMAYCVGLVPNKLRERERVFLPITKFIF